jgi:hypothetical protein
VKVYMMQEKLAAKDYEINRLKQLLVKKEEMDFEERDEPAEDKKGDDIDSAAADMVKTEA